MNRFEARWFNAVKLVNKVKQDLELGFAITYVNTEDVLDVFINDSFIIIETKSVADIIFERDTDYDLGSNMTISEFADWFYSWYKSRRLVKTNPKYSKEVKEERWVFAQAVASKLTNMLCRGDKIFTQNNNLVTKISINGFSVKYFCGKCVHHEYNKHTGDHKGYGESLHYHQLFKNWKIYPVESCVDISAILN